MKIFYTTLAGLVLAAVFAFGQTYLTPEEGYKTAYLFPDYTSVGAFDLNDTLLYINTGDTIHRIDLRSGQEVKILGAPGDYEVNHYASFLTIHPDGQTVWAGYTSDGNTDDRIYSVNVETGQWMIQARFPGNFDLLFWNDSILVSGLNSTSWGDPNAIFILDTTGGNQHRKIIDVGGNSAGMALDSSGDLYYGTSYFMDPNSLVRWDSADLAAVIGNPGISPLQISDAEKLTDLPAGANDCHVDEKGSLIFNMNQFGSDKVLAIWNGTKGNGMNLDTISVATGEWDWLGMVKTIGDFKVPEIGNSIVTVSFGRPLTEVHTADYHPFIANPLADLNLTYPGSDTVIDLGNTFSDPDDADSAIVHSVISNSNEELINVFIDGNDMYFIVPCGCTAGGETEIVVEGRSGSQVVTDTLSVTLEIVTADGVHKLPDFNIYPNPSNGVFRISGNWSAGTDLKIYNMTGSLVHEQTVNHPGQPIHISSLPDGAYILRITGHGKGFSKLIQKQ